MCRNRSGWRPPEEFAVIPPFVNDKNGCVYYNDSAVRIPNEETEKTSSSSDWTIILLVG